MASIEMLSGLSGALEGLTESFRKIQDDKRQAKRYNEMYAAALKANIPEQDAKMLILSAIQGGPQDVASAWSKIQLAEKQRDNIQSRTSLNVGEEARRAGLAPGKIDEQNLDIEFRTKRNVGEGLRNQITEQQATSAPSLGRATTAESDLRTQTAESTFRAREKDPRAVPPDVAGANSTQQVRDLAGIGKRGQENRLTKATAPGVGPKREEIGFQGGRLDYEKGLRDALGKRDKLNRSLELNEEPSLTVEDTIESYNKEFEALRDALQRFDEDNSTPAGQPASPSSQAQGIQYPSGRMGEQEIVDQLKNINDEEAANLIAEEALRGKKNIPLDDSLRADFLDLMGGDEERLTEIINILTRLGVLAVGSPR